ncbi:hypothetical protein CBM2589_U10177 [Cupriavidus taiwanensis]|uniref:Uncharacterized protein n=1 Tax=Cupriavidus taiwanensis TaxID=164546 RepID=A0A375CQH5_9BURK|nr:hypothetical protein CBM2589_U10177 [Cupriavidus taiwanensis]
MACTNGCWRRNSAPCHPSSEAPGSDFLSDHACGGGTQALGFERESPDGAPDGSRLAAGTARHSAPGTGTAFPNSPRSG